jgi:hypothetical protein
MIIVLRKEMKRYEQALAEQQRIADAARAGLFAQHDEITRYREAASRRVFGDASV